MENSNTLERLNGQVTSLITALQQAREETARLQEQLTGCEQLSGQREARVHELEEQLGLKDMELEDLAVRIEGVLGDTAATGTAPAPSDPAPSEPAPSEPAPPEVAGLAEGAPSLQPA